MTEYREPNQTGEEERNKRIKLSPESVADKVTSVPYQPSYQYNHAWDYGLETDSGADGVLLITRGVDQTCLYKSGKQTKGESYLIGLSLVLGDVCIYYCVHRVLVSSIQLGLKDTITAGEIEQTVAEMYSNLCAKMAERDASIAKPGRSLFTNLCYDIISNAKSGGWKVINDSHVITRIIIQSRPSRVVVIDPPTE